MADESLPGETASGQRNFLRAFVKTLAMLFVVLLPAFILFYPFLHRWLDGTTRGTPAPLDIPDPPAENLLLDSFIVRDASRSTDDTQYKRIEEELLKRLSTKEGDRISYSVFGTDTFPPLIPAPAESHHGVAAQQLATRNTTFSTTDFANLFNKLSDAIRRDREAQREEEKEESQRPHHADAVLIISDGVPDLTPGALHCPKDDEPFISPEIIDAFDTLVHQKYATQEPLYVRLLIAGTEGECDSSIKQAWKTALGKVSDPVTFRALSYSDLAADASTSSDLATDGSNSWGNIERELLESLRRQPRVILSLRPVQEEERVKLDSGQVFSVQYAARSFLRGGSLHVQYGSVEERESGAGGEDGVTVVEAARLHAIHDPHLSSTQPDSQPTIVASPPPQDRLWGPIKKGSIYLKPESPGKLADSSTYQLRLSIASESAFEVLPTEPIPLVPCSYAHSKNETRKAIGSIKYVPMSIGIVFFVGVLLWAFAEPKNSGHWTTKVRQVTETVFIANWKPWMIALIAFLLPMSIAGMICAPRPAFLYVAFALAGVFNFLSFYLEGSKKYPRHNAATGVDGESDGVSKSMWLNLSFHCAQGVCLPLMIEATAKQIF
jgi:hypothetical protein